MMPMDSRLNSFVIHATPDAPIACDMTTASDTPDERLAEYGRLFAHALVARDRTDNAVAFTFAAKPGVPEWIADLVAREAACCPFFSYDVECRDDQIVWSTRADVGPAAQAILDEYYAAPDHLTAGFDGLVARLADNGVDVTNPEPGRFVVES
jgi:hypothetical protein